MNLHFSLNERRLCVSATGKPPDFKSGGFVAFVSAFFSRTAGIAMLALCAYPINFDLSRA